jgi:hypothetical protein
MFCSLKVEPKGILLWRKEPPQTKIAAKVESGFGSTWILMWPSVCSYQNTVQIAQGTEGVTHSCLKNELPPQYH